MSPPNVAMAAGFWRYAMVGAVATAVHFAVLAASVGWAGLAAWLGSGLGAVVGAQIAFFGNRHFTFHHRGPKARAWWMFQGAAAAGAVLGMGVVGAAVALGWHYLLAQALATAVVLVATFVVNRRWAFAPHPGSG
jgi:putative flippase GtrA